MNKNSFYKKLEKFLTALIVVVLVCNFTAPSVLAAEVSVEKSKLNLLSNDAISSTIIPMAKSLGIDDPKLLIGGSMGTVVASMIVGGFTAAAGATAGVEIIVGIGALAVGWFLMQGLVDITLILFDGIMGAIGSFCSGSISYHGIYPDVETVNLYLRRLSGGVPGALVASELYDLRDSFWDVLKGNKNKLEVNGLAEGDIISLNHIEVGELFFDDFSFGYPLISISPEDIFTGKIDLLSIDFISGDGVSDTSWNAVRKVVSQWYKVLRMFAIIALLSMLIYTGIKIILSSSARDKSKYKEWILNWFIGVAILFSLHYIMSFVISATNELVTLMSSSSMGNVVITVNDFSSDLLGDGNSFTVESGIAENISSKINAWIESIPAIGPILEEMVDSPVEKLTNSIVGVIDTGVKVVFNSQDKYVITNYMGAIRFFANCNFLPYQLMYMIMYIALCVYTIKFLFVYLKRMLSMAFLTLVAPIVALMYPLDKINDGQAQAFNMWLKEYIYNALLQPMHLILYYVLIGSSVSLAVQNPIYAIVALAFMTEAERLLKKIFGFDKAGGGTVGGLSGAFAAGAIASNIGNVIGGAGKKIGQLGSDAADIALDMPKPIDTDYKKLPGLGGGDESGQVPLPSGDDDSGGGIHALGTGNGDSDRKGTSNNAKSGTTENNLSEAEKLIADRNALTQLGADVKTAHDQEIYDEFKKEQEEKERAFLQKKQEEQIKQLAAKKEEERKRQQAAKQVEPQKVLSTKKEAKNAPSPFQKGMTAVGKRMLKPIWDSDRSNLYNGKRWARRIGKFALGTGLGLTAAAVQAGISITDGKYNPLEGVATFTAGYMGAGKIIGGAESLVNTYTQGSLEGDPKGQMDRYIENFKDREDVIAFNKKNYPSDTAARIRREAEHYVPKGYTDLKQMKSCMKYADVLIKQGMDQQNADEQAAAVHFFMEQVKSQGQQKALYNQSAQEQYIEKILESVPEGSKATEKAKYEAYFREAIKFNDANR